MEDSKEDRGKEGEEEGRREGREEEANRQSSSGSGIKILKRCLHDYSHLQMDSLVPSYKWRLILHRGE